MLEIVTQGFQQAKAALTGKTTLTEQNIQDAVREIRIALLEGDVALEVVNSFLQDVKQRAVGEIVQLSAKQQGKRIHVTPGDHFTAICHEALVKLLGGPSVTPIVYKRPYTTIMLAGLQGTGKTTTCGKLAAYLQKQKRSPLLVAADLQRPAAVEQLKILGSKLHIPVFHQPNQTPLAICQAALDYAKTHKHDVVLFDTAGRLAIDTLLMEELQQIAAHIKPDHIYLVCDAMAGQDTVKTAATFHRYIAFTGFIMSKMDGDARGGAALSIRSLTGKPIVFIGMGEGLDKLELFRPEGLASRILGQGDIIGLMKDFEQVIDEKEAEKETKKLLRGQFTLDDFHKQLGMLRSMGSMKDLVAKMPMMGGAMANPQGLDEKTFTAMGSLIQSMTPVERATPAIIDSRRANRIAKGSGRRPEDVTQLVQRFTMMQQMMGKIAQQPSLLSRIPGLGSMLGGGNGKGGGQAQMLREMQKAIGSMTKSKRSMPSGESALAAGLPPDLLASLGGQQDGFPSAAGPLAGMPMGNMGLASSGKMVINSKQRVKAKSKLKAERKARKKSRK